MQDKFTLRRGEDQRQAAQTLQRAASDELCINSYLCFSLVSRKQALTGPISGDIFSIRIISILSRRSTGLKRGESPARLLFSYGYTPSRETKV